MNESMKLTKKQHAIISCGTLMFIVCAFLYMGISDLAAGIAAKNANAINYNDMTQSEMEKYSYISGNIEYVHSCLGEGRTNNSLSYGLKKQGPYYSNYYLVECPYSSDNTINTMIILQVGTTSNLSDQINDILDEINSDTYGADDYSLPFAGYLVKNNSDAVTLAYEALQGSGLENVKIAPYMINCVYEKGFINSWITEGICYIVFAVMVILAIFLYLKKNYFSSYVSSHNNSYSDLPMISKPRVEDYYGEIYHSNMTEADNNDK